MGCGFTGQEKSVQQHGEHHVGGRACLSCYLTLPSHVIPMPWLLLHSQGLGDEADGIEQFPENVCFFPQLPSSASLLCQVGSVMESGYGEDGQQLPRPGGVLPTKG